MSSVHAAAGKVTVRWMLAGVAVLLLAGCSTLGYYAHIGMGQLKLMRSAVPLEQALDSSQHDAGLHRQLLMARGIIEFAQRELHLDAAGRYDRFVHLDREYVVWNVFAAEPLSLDADQWCYPLVGCAPYRGYFNEAAARTAAQQYSRHGLETYVAGVPAYSTLGWFDDPLLSTFLAWPDSDLASLLFHELAHSRIWADSDVLFNESFASFVAEEGVKAWHHAQHSESVWRDWQAERQQWRSFSSLLNQAKQLLVELYASPLSEPAKYAAKRYIFESLQGCYVRQRQVLGNGRFDRIMAVHLNNAYLLSVGAYSQWVPAFRELYLQESGDWRQFYLRVQSLADMTRAERDQQLQDATRLALSGKHQEYHDADDYGAQQIDCEALSGHGFYAETAG